LAQRITEAAALTVGAVAHAEQPTLWQTLQQRISTPLGRVVRNSAVYTIGLMLPQAVSVLLLPIFTRYLSPNDYGIVGYSLTTAMFFTTVGAMAIQPFIVRYYFDADSKGQVREFFGTVFAFVALYNVTLLAVASVGLPPLFQKFHVQVPFTPFIQLALISGTMQVLGIIPMSYLRATERAVAYVGLAFLASLLNGGLSLYFIVGRHMGVLGRFYGQLAADATMLVIYLAIISRIARPAWSGEYIRQAARFCLPLVPAQFLAMFSSMSDRLILERWVPLSQLGLYSIAAGIASMAPLLTTGVYSAIQPQVFRMASTDQLDARMPNIKRYIVWLVMALMCVVIGLSRDLLTLLAGPAFRESYKVASLLIAAILLQSFITNVPSQYLTAVGKTRFEVPSRLGGGLVGLTAMLVLVPRFGIYGAGVASIVTALATLLVYRVFLRSQSPIDWLFGRDVLLMGGAALFGWAMLQIHTGNVVMNAGLKLGLVSLAGGVYLVRASSSVRDALQMLRLSWLAT